MLENYQFEEKHTISLLDQEATRENILESLYELEDQITTKDNLLLYFAGHGMMNAQETQGFWIPVEAQEKRSQYITNTRIRDILKDIRQFSEKNGMMVLAEQLDDAIFVAAHEIGVRA